MEYGQSFYEYSCEMNMPLLQVGGHLKLRYSTLCTYESIGAIIISSNLKLGGREGGQAGGVTGSISMHEHL